ncbi:MAG TPA: PilZ domain-containing protein [Kofleriaceae bacterium]|nr:PilZ domain-containing protein [Kofleriaceae bacterium]
MDNAFPPIVLAYLVLDQPRQRLAHWTAALAALDDQAAPPLATVDGHYDPTQDEVLLGVSYDELALGKERLSYVIDVALRTGFGMIQPSELSDADRRRFFTDRLARCTVSVAHQRTVVGALTELVRRVRVREAQRSSSLAAPRVSPPSLRVASAAPRAAEPGVSRAAAARVLSLVPDGAGRATARNVVARAAVGVADERSGRGPRAVTAMMDPLEAQRLAAEDLPLATPARSASARSESTRPRTQLPPVPPVPELLADGSGELSVADPYSSVIAPLPPGSIFARYLRSGRWVPIRISALSLRGAALSVGALPRVHDRVDIALAYADLRATVRGRVHIISTPEEVARRGAASFSVTFDLDERSRPQLTALLQAARAANVTIKPPPARCTRRFPVEWQVCLGTARGVVRAEALDISRDGMFVRIPGALALDASQGFSVVLDDGDRPVSGLSRVMRVIDDAVAKSYALSSGYGLQIVEMSDVDRARWQAFLMRIGQRAERRVLIGASADRLPGLQRGLAAVGYAAACATDPAALVQLAHRDERPVDACLVDAGWSTPDGAATWSEVLFPGQGVPCIAFRGDVRRAREAIDQVLSIS